MIDANQINEATGEVWSTMLGAEPSPANATETEGFVSASVSISGAWNGTVLINCAAELASQVACTMFELEQEDLDDELIADALGEVANMIGGKLKGMLPAPSTLSMPTVIRHQYLADIRYPNQTLGPVQNFEVGGHALRVAVLKGEGQAVSAVA
ncbi:MAG: chemotaxis protein CheX [Myxococcales bacterium]|nr:chemotaxis protein CheX [Myxococcales bacterium]